MSLRSHLAAAAAISLAACQSVHTQDTPAAPLDKPLSLSLGAEATPAASPAPTTPAPSRMPVGHSYTAVPEAGRTIAITFDDGPSAKLTPMLLDMLKQRKIKATFFVVGQNAAEYPDILKRIAAEGHEIGNHSWSHPQLTRLSRSGVDAQMEKTNAAIRAAVGRDPVVMRPPYGATNATLNKHYEQDYGMKVILWSVDPLDWKYRNAARVEQGILSQTGPGGIILAHDIHPSTVAAMPATLDALLSKGYKFATVSELLAMQGKAAATPTSSPSATVAVPPPAETMPAATPYKVDRYEATPSPTSEGSATQ
jgi:peptidoglycan-N-acetylglucosamine deacetylase